MEYLRTYRVFFGSIFFGILIWLLSYMLLPVNVLEPLKSKTVIFVLSCYLMVIMGFTITNIETHIKGDRESKLRTILFALLIIVLASYLLRWYELFSIRELSFSNYPKDNRNLNDANFAKSNYLFNIASILKSLYFFPLVIVLSSKLKKDRMMVLLAHLLLLLPMVEAILKGTRRSFFEIFLILLLSLLLYNYSRITIKKIVLVLAGVIAMLIISASMLYKRESKNIASVEDYYDRMLNARYNDLLPLESDVKSLFYDNTIPNPIKSFVFINLQTGQYIVHGIFEFNHIIEDSIPIAYGSYTFNAPAKLLSKIGVLSRSKVSNPSPREHVFLTAFGEFYIDFRWGALFMFFIFGMFQKYIFIMSKRAYIYKPILIYIIIINLHLPLFNYLRGSGVYPFLAFAFLLLLLFISDKILNEKSISA